MCACAHLEAQKTATMNPISSSLALPAAFKPPPPRVPIYSHVLQLPPPPKAQAKAPARVFGTFGPPPPPKAKASALGPAAALPPTHIATAESDVDQLPPPPKHKAMAVAAVAAPTPPYPTDIAAAEADVDQLLAAPVLGPEIMVPPPLAPLPAWATWAPQPGALGPPPPALVDQWVLRPPYEELPHDAGFACTHCGIQSAPETCTTDYIWRRHRMLPRFDASLSGWVMGPRLQPRLFRSESIRKCTAI